MHANICRQSGRRDLNDTCEKQHSPPQRAPLRSSSAVDLGASANERGVAAAVLTHGNTSGQEGMTFRPAQLQVARAARSGTCNTITPPTSKGAASKAAVLIGMYRRP
jgi:hypothetical protein